MVKDRKFTKLNLWYNCLNNRICCFFSFRNAYCYGIPNFTFMKCDCRNENIICFSFSRNLVFFSVFCYNSFLYFKWNLLNNFIAYFSAWFYYCFEFASLYEKWFWCIILWNWVCISIRSEHAFSSKYSFHYFLITRTIHTESICVHIYSICIFGKESCKDFLCWVNWVLSWIYKIFEISYWSFILHIVCVLDVNLFLIVSFFRYKSRDFHWQN